MVWRGIGLGRIPVCRILSTAQARREHFMRTPYYRSRFAIKNIALSAYNMWARAIFDLLKGKKQRKLLPFFVGDPVRDVEYMPSDFGPKRQLHHGVADPGSTILRCTSPNIWVGMILAPAATSLFIKPTTTSAWPASIASKPVLATSAGFAFRLDAPTLVSSICKQGCNGAFTYCIYSSINSLCCRQVHQHHLYVCTQTAARCCNIVQGLVGCKNQVVAVLGAAAR